MINLLSLFRSVIRDYIYYPIRGKMAKFRLKKVPKAKRHFYLLNTPEHGNIGDHAIVEGELKFFKTFFPDETVIEISTTELRALGKTLNRFITANDVLYITGGGYLGTLWPSGESITRQIIKQFPHQKKVMFPQTMYYGAAEFVEIEDGKRFYQASEQFLFYNREMKSYKFMQEHKFMSPENIKLVPDVVLMLKNEDVSTLRKNVLLCMRSDKEKIFDSCLLKQIEAYCAVRKCPQAITDTVISRKIYTATRQKKLEDKLNEFRSAKLVITDRLHGMIFAAITGTPCIAFNNVSKKVEGVYEWIRYLPYISFHKEAQITKEEFDRMLNFGNCNYDQGPLMHEYERMATEIRSFIEKE